MDKRERGIFKQLSKEVFGSETMYIKILKNGFKYFKENDKTMYVQRFSEDALKATMIQTIKDRKELENAKVQQEISKEVEQLPQGSTEDLQGSDQAD